MARNMSFALTTPQIRDRTKTVTRRIGWKFLNPGDEICACVKTMGLPKGERIARLARLRVVSVKQEPLHMLMQDATYGAAEAAKEGFPHLTGAQFVKMFCDHMSPIFGCATEVTRIEFEYID